MFAPRLTRIGSIVALVTALVPIAPSSAIAAPDFALCLQEYTQEQPRVDGESVVWTDFRNITVHSVYDSDIYLYDYGTGTESRVTSTTAAQAAPDVSGDRVAYTETNGSVGNSAIKAIDLGAKELTNVWVGHYGWWQRPKIDGDIIVWEGSASNSPYDWDVMAYDLASDTAWTIAGGAGDQRYPVIGGGKAVYFDSGSWWSHDLATDTTIEVTATPAGVSPANAAADDQHLVFAAQPGAGYALYAMDLATSAVETLSTSVEPYAAATDCVDVDGDTVVFSSQTAGGIRAYRYSFASGLDERITPTESGQSQAHVSGTLIAWRDTRNAPGESGFDSSDIYANRFVPGVSVPWSLISGVPAGWSASHPVTLSIDATPAAGSTTYYSVDGTAPVQYTGPFEVDGVGMHDIEYWSSNAAGREVTRTASFGLDYTPPETSVLTTAYSGYTDITFVAQDEYSAVAQTYWRVGGGIWNTGSSFSWNVVGTHVLEYYSVDTLGNAEDPHTTMFVVTPAENKVATAIGGDTRYDTAMAVSLESFPSGIPADDVEGYRTTVLATGENWPDALGAASLAGALGGPILLTRTDSLPAGVAAEISRLAADRVIIVGGPAAVSDDVEATLALLPGVVVERVSGADRYATAAAVADRTIGVLGASYDGHALVTTGLDFPDALSGAPIASHTGWPIYLMGGGARDVVTAASMNADGVTHAYLLGGTAALPVAVETALEAAGIPVSPEDRLGGADRYATAAIVAQAGVDHAGLAWDGTALATGETFPDALAGGAMQGRLGSVVLLTGSDTLHAQAQAKLMTNAAAIDELRFLGGTEALSDDVRTAALQAIQ